MKAICPIESVGSSYAQPDILSGMVDMAAVRRAIVRERKRQRINQEELAARAGLRQGHMSNIENVDKIEMKDMSARVLFQIIEHGLGKSIGEFFTDFEAGTRVADPDSHLPPATARGRDADPVSRAVTIVDAERFARSLGRTIAREIRPQGSRRRPTKARVGRPKRR